MMTEVPIPTPDPVPNFPPFVPIEETCRKWHNARVIIENRIPADLVVRIGHNMSVNIFWGHLGDILTLAPVPYMRHLGRRFKTLEGVMGKLIGPTLFDGFKGQDVSQAVVTKINETLKHRDEYLASIGAPRYRDACRHVLGIQPIKRRDN